MLFPRRERLLLLFSLTPPYKGRQAEQFPTNLKRTLIIVTGLLFVGKCPCSGGIIQNVGIFTPTPRDLRSRSSPPPKEGRIPGAEGWPNRQGILSGTKNARSVGKGGGGLGVAEGRPNRQGILSGTKNARSVGKGGGGLGVAEGRPNRQGILSGTKNARSTLVLFDG